MHYRTRRLKAAISALPRTEQLNYVIRILWKYLSHISPQLLKRLGTIIRLGDFHTSVRLPLITSLVMFILLPLMPLHPTSIPATFGAALSFAIIHHSIFSPRRKPAVHWVR
jgi:hypothetical protein